MFEQARLKLTGWYLLIIMFISISFSAIIYKAIDREIYRFEQLQRYRIEKMRHLPIPLPVNTELVQETEHRVLILLGLINGVILVASGGLGYFLAGRTLTPIKKMVEDQRRFISDASHELKTPLTSLKSAFEVFMRNSSRSKVDADALVTESLLEVDKLQYLSESLLKLSKEGRVNIVQVFETVSLKTIASEAIRKIDPVAKNKQVKLINYSSEVKVRGQKLNLTDLIVILLDNAVKYTPSDGRVELTLSKRQKTAEIKVSDTGVGIARKDLPHIFDRFYRSDIARARNSPGGYGLGLSIARQIVTDHDGEIIVTSKLHEGTTVTVHIPLFR